MAAMGSSHRMFLQSIMSHGILDAKESKDFYLVARSKYQESTDLANMQRFVQTINTCIAPFHMEIKKAVDEVTSGQFFVLVNTVESTYLQIASDFNEKEQEYFKMLVEKIIEADDGILSDVQALNLVDEVAVKKLTKREADAALGKLHDSKWLTIKEFDQQMQISLHVRAIVELEHYIRELYPDSAKDCNFCKRLCVRGQRCDQCECKVHVSCGKRYFAANSSQDCANGTVNCPSCGGVWPHAVAASSSPPRTGATSAESNGSQELPEDNRVKRRRAKQ